ncbi:thiolase family protein [Desulfofundulus thermosubterraneus]|uniref:Acetyl-CoA acetyltransferase n=1 Tax=Desulfofundulus thermosubterraneus DSM 16057 TaxID=1121432 RepID=A0A1M6CH09_9FIRM|nr:thiolase family protein [Desulfofundulus thermosubterraneus]SHI60315.1 acetyl-CoA C-acetyltransferase [Desulfofundulus thermosubterraneus DSM 16057]
MESVVITGAARTPIGDFLGSLKDVSAVDLGVIAARAAMERAGVSPEQVEDVVAGMVYKEGVKGNPARQVQLKCGIPVEAAAVTVEQQCASGMRAVEVAAQQIMLGKSSISLAVGMESMSQVPYLLMGARTGYRMGPGRVEDALLYDALHDAFHGYHMGVTAENLAERYGITRQEQDELALLSHQRAVAAIREGKFKEEIVPVEVKTRKGTVVIDTDEHPRPDTSLDALSKLRPVFKEGGTVTAGNASGINDAAAALILMAESKARELGVKPLAKIIATASFGVAPEIMGIGPAYAIPRALKYAGLQLEDIDYFEINEAFAAQFLAVNRELKLDMERVNANGSGIALGHPVGCTGVRIIVTLLSELRRRGTRYGVASLCVGGGPAMATVIEMLA